MPLPQDDAFHVLQVSRATREQLVDDQVLGSGERDALPGNLDFDRAADRAGLERRGRKDEVDTDAGLGIGDREDAGLPHEIVDRPGKWIDPHRLASGEHRAERLWRDSEGYVHVQREPGLTVQKHRLPTDQHEWHFMRAKGARQACQEGPELRFAVGGH